MPKINKFEIKVKVKKTDGMYLRTEIATGTHDDGRKLSIDSVIPDGSLLYTIGKNKYLLSSKDVLSAILEMEENNAKTKAENKK